MSGDNQYETVIIQDQANAIVGNVNISNATFLLQATLTTQVNDGHAKTVRHNQILPDGQTTLETIKRYNDGDHCQQRGAVEEIELRWTRCEDLGVGTFGDVHREETEQLGQVKSRAVKVLRRRHLKHMGVDHKKELDALIDLSQPSFVHRFVEFYSWYENHDHIYMAMEYVPFGDLESHIQAGLSESDARQIAYQVLDGLRVMHDLDLSHRDIKPANIFVIQTEPMWWVKLGDFSICKRGITRQTVLRTQVGTQGYQAPEVLGLVDTRQKDTYDSKCDIWSYGCLVFELLTKQSPFPDIRSLNDYCNEETPFPGILIKNSGGSLLFAEFAWTMLQAEPLARPTADQAIFLLSYRCESRAMSGECFEDPAHIYLRDPIGRCFKLPWQHCSGWINMHTTLKTLLSYIQRQQIGLCISRGRYAVKNSLGILLHSDNWKQVASPGMHVSVNIIPEPREETVLTSAELDQPESSTSLRPSTNDSPVLSRDSNELSQNPSRVPTKFEVSERQGQDYHEIDVVGDSVNRLPSQISSVPVATSQGRLSAGTSIYPNPALRLSSEAESKHSDKEAVASKESVAPSYHMKAAAGPDDGYEQEKSYEHSTETRLRPPRPNEELSQENKKDHIRDWDRLPAHESRSAHAVKLGLAADYIRAARTTVNNASGDPHTNSSVEEKDVEWRVVEDDAPPDDRRFSPSPPPSNRPTYIKIATKYCLPETLEFYNLPWMYDPHSDKYILIKQYISHELTEELFTHTKRIIRKRERTSTRERDSVTSKKSSAFFEGFFRGIAQGKR